jgi:hypothetical protein
MQILNLPSPSEVFLKLLVEFDGFLDVLQAYSRIFAHR